MVTHDYIVAGTHFNDTGDDSAKNYTLPFPIDFYGTNYTKIWISTNGLICFSQVLASGASCASSYTGSPQSLSQQVLIAPLWRDLVVDPFQSGRNDSDVYLGMLDPDHVLIRWGDAIIFQNSTAYLNFETIIGRDSSIKFNYGPSNAVNIAATVGISDGVGDFFARVINSSNNIASLLYTSVRGARPVIRYSTSPSLPWLVGENVLFNASGSYAPNGYIVSTLWDFGDGSNATTPIATHAYNTPGLYQVAFKVKDNSSFTATATFLAKVSTANATLTDAWPEVQFLRTISQQTFNLTAIAINTGSLPVYASVSFKATNLRTGVTTIRPSQTVQFAGRSLVRLVANFTPPATTGKYSITATLHFTPRDPASTTPAWLTGNKAEFLVQVVDPP